MESFPRLVEKSTWCSVETLESTKDTEKYSQGWLGLCHVLRLGKLPTCSPSACVSFCSPNLTYFTCHFSTADPVTACRTLHHLSHYYSLACLPVVVSPVYFSIFLQPAISPPYHAAPDLA